MHGAQRIYTESYESGWRNKIHDTCVELLDKIISKFAEDGRLKKKPEYVLYAIICDHPDRKMGLTEVEIMVLRHLALKIDGWLCYDSGKRQFVSSTVWEKRFFAWQNDA